MSATLLEPTPSDLSAYRCSECREALPEDQTHWGGVFVPFYAKDDSLCDFWCADCFGRLFVGYCANDCPVPVRRDSPDAPYCRSCARKQNPVALDDDDPFSDE